MYKYSKELMQSLGQQPPFVLWREMQIRSCQQTRKTLKHKRICMSPPPDRDLGASKGTDLPSRNGEKQ